MRAIPHNESHSSIYNKWGISLLLNVVGKDERMGCIVKIREYEYECVFVMCFVAFVVLSRDRACVLSCVLSRLSCCRVTAHVFCRVCRVVA